MIEVKPDSVWADIRVALCTILTNIEGAVTDRVGGRTTIAVGRFTPANYQLIREAE